MEPRFIVGCGQVGREVARRELDEGRTVAALARSAERSNELRALGILPVPGDLDRIDTLVNLPIAESGVYYFAPPPGHGTIDSRMRNFIAAINMAPRPRRIVVISTSGVYGDCRGEWVTEDRPPNPDSDRGRRRWNAEQQVLEFGANTGVPVVILRVPGIYGPGRLPVERLKSGEPVLSEAESPWSNRIHMHDLVRSCRAAMERGRAGGVYNISDGHPTTMTDFFNRAADALGWPRPAQISRTEAKDRFSAGMQSYLAESKRLDNRRMREELGVQPVYPDLPSGLAASVATTET